MKNLPIIALVVGLSVVACGQTVLSGRGVSSGTSRLNGQGALIYSAGTDTCTDGTQSDCTCSVLGSSCLPGIAGHPLSFRNESAVGAAPAANQPYWALPWPVTAPDATNNYSGGTPAAWNTGGYDVDFNAYMVLATGPELAMLAGVPGSTTSTWKTGDGGDMDFFSRTDSSNGALMYANKDGGATLIVYIDVAKFKNHLCSSINPCVYYTGISSTAGSPADSTHLDPQGANGWNRNPADDPHMMFEVAGDGVTVNSVTINGLPSCATGGTHSCTLTRNIWVSFIYNASSPESCSAQAPAGGQDRVDGEILPTDYVSGWHGTVKWGDDDSFAFSSGGAGLWHASTAYTSPDSFIVHSISNAKHCMFQATGSGTSGTTEPWGTGGACSNSGVAINACPAWNSAPCTDNGVTWTPRSASGGNSGATDIDGQGPGFDILSYRPGLGCSRLNTRLMKYYRGAGWSGGGASSGPMITDNLTACQNLHHGGVAPTADSIPGWTASNTCSTDALTWVPIPNGHPNAGLNLWYAGTTYHASTHDSIITPTDAYEAIADNTDIQPGVTSGWATYWTKLTPCQCMNVDYSTIHDGGGGMDASSGGFTPTGGEQQGLREFLDEPATCINNGNNVMCDGYNWEVATDKLRPCVMGTGSHCVGHSVAGWNYTYKDKQQVAHDHRMPNYPDGSPSPGTQTIPPNLPLPGDHHGTARNQLPVHDANPIFLAQTDVPSEGRRTDAGQGVHTGDGEYFGSYNLPWYNEEIAADPSGSGTVWRFAHSFNTGSSIHFDAQNAMGVVSYGGDLYALTTDAMGTRGSMSSDWTAKTYTGGDTIHPNDPSNANHSTYQYQTTGYPTPTYAATVEPTWSGCQSAGQTCTSSDGLPWKNIGHPCNGLRADGQPANSTTYTVGDTVMGITGARSFDVFQASCPGGGGSCTNGTNFNLNTCPASGPCDSDLVGTHRMDGAVLWTNLGANDCRADIVLVDLTSSHR